MQTVNSSTLKLKRPWNASTITKDTADLGPSETISMYNESCALISRTGFESAGQTAQRSIVRWQWRLFARTMLYSTIEAGLRLSSTLKSVSAVEISGIRQHNDQIAKTAAWFASNAGFAGITRINDQSRLSNYTIEINQGSTMKNHQLWSKTETGIIMDLAETQGDIANPLTLVIRSFLKNWNFSAVSDQSGNIKNVARYKRSKIDIDFCPQATKV
jgi:hypothetical protein